MPTFVDIITIASGALAVGDITLRLLKNANPADRDHIVKFITFLEGRKVLFASLDDEVTAAVRGSVDDIKKEVESLRQKCTDDYVNSTLLSLKIALSDGLVQLHKINESTAEGIILMHKSLQKIRKSIAKILAVLCSAYKIEINDAQMKEFIINYALPPK